LITFFQGRWFRVCLKKYDLSLALPLEERETFGVSISLDVSEMSN